MLAVLSSIPCDWRRSHRQILMHPRDIGIAHGQGCCFRSKRHIYEIKSTLEAWIRKDNLFRRNAMLRGLRQYFLLYGEQRGKRLQLIRLHVVKLAQDLDRDNTRKAFIRLLLRKYRWINGANLVRIFDDAGTANYAHGSPKKFGLVWSGVADNNDECAVFAQAFSSGSPAAKQTLGSVRLDRILPLAENATYRYAFIVEV
jgi:hypothetical protein